MLYLSKLLGFKSQNTWTIIGIKIFSSPNEKLKMKAYTKKISLPLYFIISILIFAIDLITPKEFSIWVTYIFPVLGVAKLGNKKYVIFITMINSIFLVLAYLFSSDGMNSSYFIPFGRIVGLITFWAINNILIRNIEADKKTYENEYRFLKTFELAAVGMEHILPNGKWLRFNDKFTEMLGYTREELEMKTYQDVTHREDISKEKELKEKLLNNQIKDFTIEKRYIKKDGSVVWAYLTCSLLYEEYSKLTYILSVVKDITQHKKAEEQIQYQAGLLSNVHDAIIATDGNMRITYWNKVAESILGWKEEEVLGKNSADLFQTIFPNSSREAAIKLLEETGLFESEILYRHKNGNYRTVHNRTSALLSNEGIHKGFVTSFRDITERKLLEENLRQRYEEVETLMDVTPVAIWVADDPQCNVIRGNRMANEFYEAESKENVSANMTLARRFFRNGIELKPDELTMQEAAIKNIDIRNSELEVLLPSGNWLYMLGSASPLRDASGNVRGCVGAFINVTERKKIEKEMILSKQWLERIADTTPDIIFILDIIENKNIYSNRSILEMLGYTPDEFSQLENIFEKVIFSEDLNRVSNFYSNMTDAKPGEVRVLMHRSLRKDSSMCWLEVRVTPFTWDKQGKLKEIIGIAHDITDIKNAQSKLEETLEELQRSNKDLEQFAYIASHDLQEPLRMVKGYTDLLMKRYSKNFDANQMEFFGFISDGATRMYQLINALLQYSRITSKGKEFEIIDCNEVIQAVLIDLKIMIEEERAKIFYEKLPKVSGDKVMLRQLFQNLIQNAIKFKSNLEPEIRISYERKAENWLICVSDNGIGIAPEYHEKIFLIFQRLHNRDKYPGTGIGLAVCKKIVEHHGGQICLESEIGKGTTFYFTLPIN